MLSVLGWILLLRREYVGQILYLNNYTLLYLSK